MKRKYRSRKNRVFAGIAGGLGSYFNVDPVLFRILFVLLLLPGCFSVFLYIILIFIIPIKRIKT